MTDRIFAGIADYAEAYRSGRSSPTQVVQRLLQAVTASEQRTPPMRVFIALSEKDVLEQARHSTERVERGEARGPLEGVPIAIKDEIDVAGYPTTVGTSFLGSSPAQGDATVVARLRAAGALIVGKTNMHEVGLGVTGINPHHGSARNPYAPAHVTGGSSSGSAAAVAAGLCPAAVGADGGGSVRIPAALCGVAGLKPTFGRVSEAGAAPLCWSLAHIGPLCASVHDAALMLEVMSGPDPADPNTLGQPALGAESLEGGVAGLRIGWPASWVAQASEPVRRLCRTAVERLSGEGARVCELEIEHLDLHRVVQYLTIGVEMATAQYEHRRTHQRDYGADTRLLLEVASQVPAVDYLRAQRLRSQIRDAFARAFREVDLIATPATATTAPLLRAAAESAGESDDAVLENLTAFSFAANLTGLPALAVPVGYLDGLPVGLQLMGSWWRERQLLRAGIVVEKHLERQRPAVGYRPLD